MHFAIIFKVLGILLMLFSLTLIPPIVVSYIYQDQAHIPFFTSQSIIFSIGFLAWIPVYKTRQDLKARDGFLVTSLFWVVLGLAGSLPFMLVEETLMSFTDAAFESLSGLTTTGATVITGLDDLPKSILFYRQQLQWLGGIGIIVIAVAILPMLGIGGMQLYRTEAPGPVKDSKLTPRITQTAKALFIIYMTITLACALSFWLAGMSAFDAICHAFSTVAIGGFSTYDDSIGHFQSPAIMLVTIFFMVLAAINFALHFVGWHSKSILHYFRDSECQFYFNCLLLGALLTVCYLYFTGTYDFMQSALYGSFEFVSILTTTGFGVTDYSLWPSFLPVMIFLFGFMGGCGGSTAGGIKVMRVMMICKQGIRELERLIHPNAVIPIKVGNKVVSGRIVDAVWGFFAAYIVCFMIMMVLLLATGLDFMTAFSAVGACINNIGPGMGDVSLHYGDLNSFAKWVLNFAMLLGRLEVFTLLVLFSPMFWRR